MKGYMGKYLVVNLTDGSFEVKQLNDEICYRFIGGAGLGARILYSEMAAGIDPFAPESVIGFVAGALNGTSALLGGRYTVVSKSPVTGGFNDANAGGSFGPYIRKSGFDAIFFKGIAKNPVYVLVDDGEVSVRDASHLWGKCVVETENTIKEELGDKRIGIASIGPAGEHLSYMAAVMNDQHRAAARGGTGAVIGSKNLKALVCKGTHSVDLASKEDMVAANKAITDWEKNGPVAPMVGAFHEMGTGVLTVPCMVSGDAGVKNWAGAASADFPQGIEGVATSAQMDPGRKIKRFACNSCPIGCGAYYHLDDATYKTDHNARPEYETVGWFTSGMLINSEVPANVCTYLCNEYGLDTISTGGTIAWAMECYSGGILTKDELDGIELSWGNGDAVIAVCEKIAKGEGVGAVLQNGSRFAADHFGKGHECLVTANGIELPMHDPRYSPPLGRMYKYDPTPGRHVKGGLNATYGNNPPEVKYNYDNTGKADAEALAPGEWKCAAGWCDFSGFGINPGGYQAQMRSATGQPWDDEEFALTGYRMNAMRLAFNLREGFRRKDAHLDERVIGNPPLVEGPLAGITIDVEKMADNLFDELGYTRDWVPTKETLEKLGGLDDVIVDLYGIF